MAKAKTDVAVSLGKMTAKKSELDPKGNMSKVMTKIAKTVLSKAKGINTKSAGKEGYEVSGTLAELTKSEKGSKTTISCKISFLIAEMPRKKMIGAGESKASIQGASKDVQGDAVACVEAVTEHAINSAVDKIKKLAK